MKIAFVFSGQGAQKVGMGKDFYEAEEVSRTVYDRADSVLGWKVSDVCFNGPEDKLTSTICCQPAIYTTSMALTAAFQKKYPDIRPEATAGLSLGEYAAFACAGYFSFDDALKLLEKRAQFMDAACKAAEGKMICILGADPDAVAEACKQCAVDVANYNCPGQIVISGTPDGTAKAAELIRQGKVKRIIPLNVAGAFHSRMMASAEEALKEYLAKTPVKEPLCPTAQNYTGKLTDGSTDIKANLAAQVSGSVHWESCVREMADKAGIDTFIEFGPGNVLSGLIKKILPGISAFSVSKLEDLNQFSF